MIVVALIAIIASFAIPSLQAATKDAKETRAVSHLKMLLSVNEQYRLRFGSYATTVNNLVNSGILLHFRQTGVSGPDGYGYSYSAPRYHYEVHAFPDELGVTGDRGFFLDESGVIRFDLCGAATSTSSSIDG